MNKALRTQRTATEMLSPEATSMQTARPQTSAKIDWRKKMSDNVAYGLLVYTGLQIFVTMHEIQGSSASILPLFVLVVLVAAIIPLFRQFERRWEHLTDEQAHNMAYKAAFRRDQIKVWALAAILPIVITGGYRALSMMF